MNNLQIWEKKDTSWEKKSILSNFGFNPELENITTAIQLWIIGKDEWSERLIEIQRKRIDEIVNNINNRDFN